MAKKSLTDPKNPNFLEPGLTFLPTLVRHVRVCEKYAILHMSHILNRMRKKRKLVCFHQEELGGMKKSKRKNFQVFANRIEIKRHNDMTRERVPIPLPFFLSHSFRLFFQAPSD